jgi:hypothetical protein
MLAIGLSRFEDRVDLAPAGQDVDRPSAFQASIAVKRFAEIVRINRRRECSD